MNAGQKTSIFTLIKTNFGPEDRVIVAVGNNGECRYKKSNWEECDPTTNLERRTLTLKKGGASCEPVKILTRKCKKACRYEKGEWEECNAETNMRSRTDTLKPKSDASCQPTRVITKKCKKACKYDRQADWSRCENGKKTKVMELVQGNPATCEPNRTVTKPCRVGGGGGHHRRGQTPQGPKHIPSKSRLWVILKA
ncbi:hypothetical protein LAZ67_18002562 [Cordylochernes scorpioides]|uniref:Pleiotrophin/Midkine C-terminal domain-containing protein n=1 Tax=Cordylochernes scorpioides TaxID=51811 RepID=A0ABY6LIU4_9ARAC|nr:hypothetical protein LAZ67_18002562 [Cordylochernes scorpioides]